MRRTVERRTDQPLHAECVRLARYWVPAASRATAIEATAWFEIAGAGAAELDEALCTTNTRLTARTLAAWLATPGPWHPDRDELRRLAVLPADEPLRLTQSMPLGMGDQGDTFAFLLSEPVRVLAALALAAGDLPLPPAPDWQPLLQRYCGSTPAELAAFVRERRTAGTLTQVLDAIEAECRTQLGVAAGLRWPTAADGR